MTAREITNMVREIAGVQARLYYRAEEGAISLVVQSVYMMILAIVAIQLTRAGVDAENVPGIPDVIAHEMHLVGWNLECLGVCFNLD